MLNNNFSGYPGWINDKQSLLGVDTLFCPLAVGTIDHLFLAWSFKNIKTVGFILLFILSSLSIGFSQDSECGTVVSQEKVREIFENRKTWANNTRSFTNVVISVQPHMVHDNGGNGGIDDSVLSTLETKLNDHFSETKIQFNFCTPNEIKNTNYLNITGKWSAEEKEMAESNNVPTSINIYFLKNISKSYAPSLTSSNDWLVINNGGSISPSSISHEMGHHFGLLHTHSNAMGNEHVLFLSPSDPSCSNCSTAGDGFCDTSADPNPSLLPSNTTLRSYVDSNCSVSMTLTDLSNCNKTYYPMARNVMSYSRHACRNEFSDDQIEAMQDKYTSSYSLLTSSCTSISASCFDNSKNGTETDIDCGGTCISCPCKTQRENGGAICGGDCPPCGNGNNGGISDYNCETGCNQYLRMNCTGVESTESGGQIYVSNIQIKNNSSSITYSNLDFRCSLVGTNGSYTLGTEPTGKIWAPGALHILSKLYWYSNLNVPDGSYNIRIELLDNGTVFSSCISTSYFHIGGGGGPGPGPTDCNWNNGTFPLGSAPSPYYLGGILKVPNYLYLPPNGKNVIVPSGNNAIVEAGDYILLRPGFKASKGGVFNAEIKSCTTPSNSNKQETQSIISQFNVYPNPFSESTTIELQLEEEAQVTVFVSDMTGAMVAKIAEDQITPSGLHQLVFDGRSLSSGMYFATIIAGKHKARQKMILMK